MKYVLMFLACNAFDAVITLGLQWSGGEILGHHIPYIPLFVGIWLSGLMTAASRAISKALK